MYLSALSVFCGNVQACRFEMKRNAWLVLFNPMGCCVVITMVGVMFSLRRAVQFSKDLTRVAANIQLRQSLLDDALHEHDERHVHTPDLFGEAE